MHRYHRRRLLVGALILSVVTAACGSDSVDTDTTTSTSTTSESTTTTEPVGLAQLAIWPAANVVFSTPEEAASDFVRSVLRVTPALGEFQQGDNRSGEIEVYSLGEGEPRTKVVRSLLLLRQLGPSDGWFVLAAINDHETITTPASMAEVPAGPLTVAGAGRGFEATVNVSALVAGDATRLDEEIAMGGSTEAAEPFSVSLDLSGAEPGDTVVLLVRGGTGLESDPGDFSAIPVVITG